MTYTLLLSSISKPMCLQPQLRAEALPRRLQSCETARTTMLCRAGGRAVIMSVNPLLYLSVSCKLTGPGFLVLLCSVIILAD